MIEPSEASLADETLGGPVPLPLGSTEAFLPDEPFGLRTTLAPPTTPVQFSGMAPGEASSPAPAEQDQAFHGDEATAPAAPDVTGAALGVGAPAALEPSEAFLGDEPFGPASSSAALEAAQAFLGDEPFTSASASAAPEPTEAFLGDEPFTSASASAAPEPTEAFLGD